MPIRVIVLTISDRSSQGEREDLSGPALVGFCQKLNWNVVATEIIPDEFELIKSKLNGYCENNMADLILTTGGTGFATRDVTPEATLAVIQKRTPGLSEEMRRHSIMKTPHGMLSRGESGILSSSLIINLPGSPIAAVENLGFIIDVLPHAIELIINSPGSEANHQVRACVK